LEEAGFTAPALYSGINPYVVDGTGIDLAPGQGDENPSDSMTAPVLRENASINDVNNIEKKRANRFLGVLMYEQGSHSI
jgi:hypothetical protein